MIIGKILDKTLALVGADRIEDGVVVDKNDYSSTTVSVPKQELVGHSFVSTTDVEQVPERFSINVKGKGVFGTEVTEEIYVDASVYDAENKGDKYGSSH